MPHRSGLIQAGSILLGLVSDLDFLPLLETSPAMLLHVPGMSTSPGGGQCPGQSNPSCPATGPEPLPSRDPSVPPRGWSRPWRGVLVNLTPPSPVLGASETPRLPRSPAPRAQWGRTLGLKWGQACPREMPGRLSTPAWYSCHWGLRVLAGSLQKPWQVRGGDPVTCTHFPEEETEAQGSHSSVRFQAQSGPREADITLCAQPEWPGDTSPMPGVPRLGSRHICSYPGLRRASPTPAARPQARGSWALLTTE